MKKYSYALLGLALMFTTLQLHAQINGCVDSPENPTAILALVGSAGVFLAGARNRIRARRASRQK
jgi:XrtJ-associated TM-motif-TM protein